MGFASNLRSCSTCPLYEPEKNSVEPIDRVGGWHHRMKRSATPLPLLGGVVTHTAQSGGKTMGEVAGPF